MFFHQEGEGPRVDVAYAGSHHKPLGRGKSHRSIHTLAVEYCGNRTAVADVAGYDFLCVDVYTEYFANPP